MKLIICPKCNNQVTQFLPVDYINGDSLWQCETCNFKFKTDKEDNVK